MPMDRERGSLALRLPDNRITFNLAAIMRAAHKRASFTMRSALSLDRRRQAMSFALKAVWREAKIEAAFHRQMIERDAYVRAAALADAANRAATAAHFSNDADRIRAELFSEEMSDRPSRGLVESLRGALAALSHHDNRGGAHTTA